MNKIELNHDKTFKLIASLVYRIGFLRDILTAHTGCGWHKMPTII